MSVSQFPDELCSVAYPTQKSNQYRLQSTRTMNQLSWASPNSNTAQKLNWLAFNVFIPVARWALFYIKLTDNMVWFNRSFRILTIVLLHCRKVRGGGCKVMGIWDVIAIFVCSSGVNPKYQLVHLSYLQSKGLFLRSIHLSLNNYSNVSEFLLGKIIVYEDLTWSVVYNYVWSCKGRHSLIFCWSTAGQFGLLRSNVW